MTTFDWCLRGQCEKCIGKYQRFYHGTKRVGRKKVPAIIYIDEYRECIHKCHGNAPEPKRRGRKKK